MSYPFISLDVIELLYITEIDKAYGFITTDLIHRLIVSEYWQFINSKIKDIHINIPLLRTIDNQVMH